MAEEGGLDEEASSKFEFVGDSGTGAEPSVIRESDRPRSRLCARFWLERDLANFSFSLASKSESEPRLSASSCRLCTTGGGPP